MKSHRVRFWEIRPNKTAKGASYTVRWTVAGREKSATFARKAQAERHRSKLMQAADKGEVLYRIYAHCLDGDDERWFARMEQALG